MQKTYYKIQCTPVTIFLTFQTAASRSRSSSSDHLTWFFLLWE